MPKMFKRNFNTLGFTSPRWQNVQATLYNPAKWARFRIERFHALISRFKKK